MRLFHYCYSFYDQVPENNSDQLERYKELNKKLNNIKFLELKLEEQQTVSPCFENFQSTLFTIVVNSRHLQRRVVDEPSWPSRTFIMKKTIIG